MRTRLHIRACWLLVCLIAETLAVSNSSQASAQTLTTIRSNGPNANRINLVLLSEGYQSGQLATFLQAATNAATSILSTPPYREYSNYFNVYAISVASAQSGSDHHTPSTTLVDTYFNSTFDSYAIQRLITIPPNDWDSDYSHGEGKVVALLQALMPEYDLAALIVNDTQYGGSGGSVLITSVNPSAPEIVVHESGHTFGGLADEYTSAYPGWTPTENPNATAQTNRPLIKWNSWILPATPVPTPAVSPYLSVVGLFQGAEYQTSGWYRPKNDCKMNHLGIPFCEVCGEQLVKSTYQTVRSFDSFNPLSTNFTVTTTQAVSFSLSPLQPATHNLTFQWFTNGIQIDNATNPGLTLLPQVLNSGTNLVRAEIRDLTTLVRNDPANRLSNSVTWRVNVAITQLRLLEPRWLAGGKFGFTVTGTAPNGFVIQSGTNLLNWVPLSTNTLVGGQFLYTNSGANSFSTRFYRALANP